MDNQIQIPKTRRRISKKTSWTILWGDRIAHVLISIGGIGTIIVVSLVFFFLCWVVMPLFLSPSIKQITAYSVPWDDRAAEPVLLTMDEFQVIGWALFEDGAGLVFRVDTGEEIERFDIGGGKEITAIDYAQDERSILLGFADGTVQLGRVGVTTEFLFPDNLDQELVRQAQSEPVVYQNGMLIQIPNGQLRWHRFAIDFSEPISVSENNAVVLLHHINRSNGVMFAALFDNNELRIESVREQKNLLTGKMKYFVSSGEIPFSRYAGDTPPSFLHVSGLGTHVALIWNDGRLLRFDTRKVDQPVFAEDVDLTPNNANTITAVEALIGQSTLMIGKSDGMVEAWFPVRAPDTDSPDGKRMVKAHEMPEVSASALRTFSPSQRSRVVAAGFEDGTLSLFHVTTNQNLNTISSPQNQPVKQAFFAQKENGLLLYSDNTISHYTVDIRYPEVTFSSIFLPVWYEGYTEPAHVWQSSSGGDSFEPKYGLYPLVFGTLKATVYTMLFALPLALLAAIYTSEFMNPRTKSVVKPTIELMASLPSVVLGFLAALIIAPVVETFITTVVTMFVILPFLFILGAYSWQLLPVRIVAVLRMYKLMLMAVLIPLSVYLSYHVGWVGEYFFFGGDIKSWLDGQTGTAAGGWMFVLLPLSALLCVWVIAAFINPFLLSISAHWSREKHALVDFIKFACASVAAFALSWGLSVLFSHYSWDLRGTVLDTYEQRNALVVGFIMGFAVIPIIYTIAEDALSSVPEHLRAGSLACGATPWQTAVLVVLPTAMSGIFSAVMIGLGRAIGETMIVLMAAGNTPVMDWNIFNGFRTLSANIAVELPEAVRDSTHYRTLFLAALCLFFVTFVINTAAEIIRQRYRKQAHQL